MRDHYDMLNEILEACSTSPQSKKQLLQQTRIPKRTLSLLLEKLSRKGVLTMDWKTQPAGNRSYHTYTLSPHFGMYILMISRELKRLMGEN